MSKFPKEYRITLKEQIEHIRDADGNYVKDDNDYCKTIVVAPLGFANVYEPNSKAYAKREHTQDEWAYTPSRYMKDGKIWSKGNRWDKRDIVPYDEPFADYLQPRIIINEPLEGFKIVKSVSRYSTSNKLWRILDPRGFELEVNTNVMENLILGGTIVNGEIIGACIWAGVKTLVRV